MKRTVLALIIAVAAILVISAAAGIAISMFDLAIDKEYLQLAQEKLNVEKAIKSELPSIQKDFSEQHEAWGLKDKSQIPTTIGNAYKVYPVKPNFVEIFNNEKTFAKCFDNNATYWEIPLKNRNGEVINTAKVAFFEGKWQTVIIGLDLPTGDVAFSSDKNQISNLLAKANIRGVNSVKHLRTGIPKLDIIYIDSNSGEYLIPMSTRPDIFGKLSMRFVYKADEFVNLVKDYYKPLPESGENGPTMVH
ncbi:MAG: hypothetical protein QME63_03850 [Actinomycetota bacterium]|nr:hypothetical protein [Actinomycetota bacterium]